MKTLLIGCAALGLAASSQAFAASVTPMSSTATAGLQTAAVAHAKQNGWKVICGGTGIYSCTFYDPAQKGGTIVNGQMVAGMGSVQLQPATGVSCKVVNQRDVCSPAPKTTCSYQVAVSGSLGSSATRLAVNVCRKGWASTLWPPS